jgi:hypothetical protein
VGRLEREEVGRRLTGFSKLYGGQDNTSFPPILICSLEGTRNYVPTIPIKLQ